VTGDTVALHLALALARPTVALFGPTCSQEIDMFGLGEKVASQLACAPCYRRTCEETPTCMEALPVESVWQALRRVWQRPS
jgi:ADP-heptose:LPS heptosyltransferase